VDLREMELSGIPGLAEFLMRDLY